MVCFEEMIFKSKFISGTGSYVDALNFSTLEKYYENILEEFTDGTPYQYVHKKTII